MLSITKIIQSTLKLKKSLNIVLFKSNDMNNMEIPLTSVNPNLIEFDENNPRGETADEIESDSEFKKLKNSVNDYNILVPLIVRKNNSKTKPYKLVDGERRLRAALDRKKKLVPAHIIEGNEENAKILAYQIHMLRKPWAPQAEIKSIKEIVAEMQKEGLNEDKLKAELISKTGMSSSRAGDILTIRDLLSALKCGASLKGC